MALEDTQKILNHDNELYEYFKRKLNQKPLPLENYFGLRLEIRIAASFIDANIPFKKSETPDFILYKPSDNNIGIECTSAHLNLWSINKSRGILYKVESALKKKSSYPYKTPFNVLAIDISNLLFHEGQKKYSAILADMDKSRPILIRKVDESIFQSLVYLYYAAIPIENSNGVTLHSCYTRIDRSEINPDCKKFLDIKYPFGDKWLEGNVFKIV